MYGTACAGCGRMVMDDDEHGLWNGLCHNCRAHERAALEMFEELCDTCSVCGRTGEGTLCDKCAETLEENDPVAVDW